jgi:hypothetical protein
LLVFIKPFGPGYLIAVLVDVPRSHFGRRKPQRRENHNMRKKQPNHRGLSKVTTVLNNNAKKEEKC